jgi:limonene-1,2-epoxide hydrolase
VVEGFLEALSVPDLDKALTFVAEDLVYTNVGMPTVRGRAGLAKVFRSLERPNGGFEVYLHAISANGPVVLTERTDVIKVGSFRAQFWVCGRFDVHDGEITLWRDAFDYVDILRGTVRGLAGLLLPALRPEPPASTDTPPGR